jgi:hypothetical protein
VLRFSSDRCVVCFGSYGLALCTTYSGTSPHVIANTLKRFLLTLPEPLLTYKCALMIVICHPLAPNFHHSKWVTVIGRMILTYECASSAATPLCADSDVR